MAHEPNTLYYGDNLDVLRRHVKDETVNLVYLDPPFKSNQDYNVLFAEKNGTASAARGAPRVRRHQAAGLRVDQRRDRRSV